MLSFYNSRLCFISSSSCLGLRQFTWLFYNPFLELSLCSFNYSKNQLSLAGVLSTILIIVFDFLQFNEQTFCFLYGHSDEPPWTAHLALFQWKWISKEAICFFFLDYLLHVHALWTARKGKEFQGSFRKHFEAMHLIFYISSPYQYRKSTKLKNCLEAGSLIAPL